MIKRILSTVFLTAILSSSSFAEDGGDGCIRIVSVAPTVDFVTIVNNTSVTVDLSSYRLCSSFSYSAISNLFVISGDATSVPPDEAIIVQWTMDDNASDVALYLPTGSFSDPNAMVDFMQYGSGGNGRESEAADAGYWVAGTFVQNSFTMVFIGECFDFGVEFWFTVTSVDEFLSESLEIGPNPINDELIISLPHSLPNTGVFRVIDITGKVILEEQFGANGQIRYEIETSTWSDGLYFVQLEYDGELKGTRKLVKS